MSAGISKKLQKLDDFLLSDVVDDDAMLLSELDGLLAGVIVCPELIMPSEWMPLIWGEEAPEFESLDQVQTINGLIMEHYNDIIRQLDRGRYSPIYDIDIDDSLLWESWIVGFLTAMTQRPDAWKSLGEEQAHKALSTFMRLHEIATTPTAQLEPLDTDEELEKLAPDLIAFSVEELHRARLAQASSNPASANENHHKVGRNDPCPCGSGKKFKKCCLN